MGLQRRPLPLHLRPPPLRQEGGRGRAPVLQQLLQQALRLLQGLRLLQLQALLLWHLRIQGILLSGELTLDGLPRISTSTTTKTKYTAKNLFQKKPCIKQN